MSALLFSAIDVTRQAFFRTSLSYAIVNLKPILPGHVLVAPIRVVERLHDLTPPELTALMTTVQTVGRGIERAYNADGLTIACQDGKAAGQTIPHVHFHILPRKFRGDPFAHRNDDIYQALDHSERSLPAETGAPSGWRVDSDENRKARTMEEMVQEAMWLKTFFERDSEIISNQPEI